MLALSLALGAVWEVCQRLLEHRAAHSSGKSISNISHRVRLSSSRDGDVCKWFTGVNISLASPPVFPIVSLVMEEECSGGCDA